MSIVRRMSIIEHLLGGAVSLNQNGSTSNVAISQQKSVRDH